MEIPSFEPDEEPSSTQEHEALGGQEGSDPPKIPLASEVKPSSTKDLSTAEISDIEAAMSEAEEKGWTILSDKQKVLQNMHVALCQNEAGAILVLIENPHTKT